MGKTALVTGASRGIARAVAMRLAHDGFAVVVTYASNAALADAVISEIASAGGQAMAIKELFLTGKSDAQVAELSKLAPLVRLGQPDDIASVISFLAGPDGGWVNSQVIRANGGFA